MTSPIITNRTFNVASFERLINNADTNKDGSLTRAELDNYKSFPDIAQYSKLMANILSDNFNAIAYRAQKNGEVITMYVRPTDSTIEIADLKKLAEFDGVKGNITIDDFKSLKNGVFDKWPTVTTNPPQPEPPKPEPKNDILEKLLPILLLFSLFGSMGGAQQGQGGGIGALLPLLLSLKK